MTGEYSDYPYFSDARIEAGGPFSADVKKCRLVPLRRGDYKVEFIDAEWAALRAAFPSGVCDWSKPSIADQPSIPWMTYAGGPGGQPLGVPPASRVTYPRCKHQRREQAACRVRPRPPRPRKPAG